jgi:TM2 domain-containing membrane protein YozV/RNA polymerase subunit RPABC4/transcription elongation factor Spt4
MYCRNCATPIPSFAEYCPGCGLRQLNNRRFCQNCALEVGPQQEVCLRCGATLIGSMIASPGQKLILPGAGKSATTAAILSCLVIGVGQMYLGQVLKGILLLGIAIALGLYSVGLAVLPISVIAIIDAYQVGRKLEKGRPVGEWEFF